MGGLIWWETIPRLQTAAILEIDISPYLSVKLSDFYEMLYTSAADFELDERHVIKNEKVALDRFRIRQNVFLVLDKATVLASRFRAMLCKRGLCRHAVSVRPSVCLSVCRVRKFCRNR